MYCSKCGNELSEGMKYCNKCGTTVVQEKNSNIDNETLEFKTKFEEMNNIIDKYIKNEKHSLEDYNFICRKFGELEKRYINNRKIYMKELEFFVTINLYEDTYFFSDIKFEAILDDVMKNAFLASKNNEEREEIINKYNKEEIVQKYKEKIKDKNINCNEIRNLNIGTILKIVTLIVIVGGLIIFGINYGSSKNNINTTNNNSSVTSSNGELPKSEANRIFEATGNYVEKNMGGTLGVGKFLEDGTYQFKERQGDKYIYAITIEYNPLVHSGSKGTYTDTTQIKTKTVYTLYDSSIDKFSVYLSLEAAQENINN